jgi:hypothetical protein
MYDDLVLIIVIAIVAFLVKRHRDNRRIEEENRQIEEVNRRIKEENRRSEEVRNRRSEAIAECIAQHEQTLAKKRRQLVQRDEYGNEDIRKWNKEKEYFINTVLIPYLTEFFDKEKFKAPHPYLNEASARHPELTEAYVNAFIADPEYFDLEALYPEFDEAVELGAETGLASLPASDTITDITDGQEYECFCADLLSQSGWETRVTGASGDQGVDIIGHYDGLRVVFQCEFYRSPVGNKAVQEVVAARIHEQADLAVVISNAAYTKSAEMLAGTTNTILIHHDDIPTLKEKIVQRGRAAMGNAR